jgi:hypothetical protein
LLFRDPVECLEWLEANPEFSGEKDYVPYEEYFDKERTNRCYSEVASGEAWNQIQTEFKSQPQITVMPYILASDSTHLTNFSGDKKIKPLLITSGHIQQHVRAASSKRAYLCLAMIPEGKFPNVEYATITEAKEMPGVLSRRLYHTCALEVLKPLKKYSKTPKLMIDSEGNKRQEVFRLVAYIADLLEQTLIAGLAPNQCIPCVAGTKSLGNPIPCEARTGLSILDQITKIKSLVDPHDAYKFYKEARKVGLNGVDNPWWSIFPEIDICQIICPDVLHGLHKGFKDHCATWNINLISKLELDSCYKRLPKYPGFRHFSQGISKISQWSGREHRELQRNFLATIAGCPDIPSQALKATRAELDFIYTAQYRSHSEETLTQLEIFNQLFHRYKDIFITTGARCGKNGTINHFNIPKLHTRHHYPEFIRRLGSTANFSTETAERYHIEYAKKAYKGVSPREYLEQMVRWLDRQEKVFYFDRYLKWRFSIQEKVSSTSDDISADEEDLVKDIPVPQDYYEPVLAKKPHLRRQPLDEIYKIFQIDENIFKAAFGRFQAQQEMGSAATGRGWIYTATSVKIPKNFQTLDIWLLFRLKLPLLDELHDPSETRIIHAEPKRSTKEGVRDVVFVDLNSKSSQIQVGIKGKRILILCLSDLI